MKWGSDEFQPCSVNSLRTWLLDGENLAPAFVNVPRTFRTATARKGPNLQYSSVHCAVHVRQPFNFQRLIRPTCIFGRFCQFFWRIGLLRQDAN